MTNTNDDIKLLKNTSSYISLQDNNYLKFNEMQGKALSPIKTKNKVLPLKPLNFNPISFMSYKYSPKTLKLMNFKNLYLDKNDNTILNKNENKEYIYSINTKRLKLKPLNKIRSCSQLFQKNDDILIPSEETSQEIIKYNLSKGHNTLLNYYHKNHKNLQIINFIKTNPYEKNFISNSLNKSSSLNKSLYYNTGQISGNEISTHFNQKNDSMNPSSTRNERNSIKNNNSSSQKKKRRKKIDYESEMFFKKVPYNLRVFSNHFFEQEKEDINKEEEILSPKNNSNSNYQIMDFKGKSNLIATKLTDNKRRATYKMKKNKKEDFHHIMKNPFKNYLDNKFPKKNILLENNGLANKIQKLLLNPDISKIGNNYLSKNKINNENKNLSYKEIRAMSKKGFEKMKADKYKKFNLLVKNTNKEVIQLEKKLDELLEENKKIFQDEYEDINL